MSPQSFQKLVFLIPHEDFGPKNPPKTWNNYLNPETKVMMTLRWLAGGSMLTNVTAMECVNHLSFVPSHKQLIQYNKCQPQDWPSKMANKCGWVQSNCKWMGRT
jgi:hypothetical protein